MRSQILGIGLLGVTLLAPVKAWAPQTTMVSVTIHVTDPIGTPVPGAQIHLVPAPDPAPTKLATDRQGNLSLKLKSGGYALVVSVPGFKVWSERIYVAAPDGEAAASQLFPVALQLGASSSPGVIFPKGWLVLNANAYNVPVGLSPDDFRTLPHITIKVHNSDTNADESYSGVPLATLLVMVNAPIGTQLQKEELTSYVVASSSDESAVLSLAEVDPNFQHGQVLVADARNGQPLAGPVPFQLIVSGDKSPARWVRNLDFISLQRAR
jgi:hypothetical protein